MTVAKDAGSLNQPPVGMRARKNIQEIKHMANRLTSDKGEWGEELGTGAGSLQGSLISPLLGGAEPGDRALLGMGQ